MDSLPTPDAATGEGILTIEATPWAIVWIDDRKVGETPIEARVSSGTHRVRGLCEVGKSRQDIAISVGVAAGRRKRSHLNFND
jgi:hypothetical protein